MDSSVHAVLTIPFVILGVSDVFDFSFSVFVTEILVFCANSKDPEPTLLSVESDLGLDCLPRSPVVDMGGLHIH